MESCSKQMITINIEKKPCLIEVEWLLKAEYEQHFVVPNEMWAGIYYLCHYGLTPQEITQNIVRNEKLKNVLEALNTKLGSISPKVVAMLRNLIVDQGKDVNSAIEQVFPNTKLNLFKS